MTRELAPNKLARFKIGIAAVSVLVGVATLGISSPASAWGSGTFTTSGCTGYASKFSLSNDGNGRAVAGTYESGNICPGGRQILGAAIRYVSGVNGGGVFGSSNVTGYTSVQTPSYITTSSLYAGGRHRFGSTYSNS